MTTTAPAPLPPEVVSGLRRSVAGDTVFPSDAAYAGLVRGHNLAVVHAPAVVVVPRSETDVADAVAVARGARLSVHVQATGHGALAPVVGGLLLRTHALDAVVVDPIGRTVAVGAGATWGAVLAAAQPHGLAPVSTHGAGVGVVGSILGGGLGPQSRALGLASDHVLAARLVGGDGFARVARRGDPLLAAVLGGAVRLGVITQLTLALAARPEVWGGERTVPDGEVRDQLDAWLAWSATAPSSTGTSATVVTLPVSPALPAALRGSRVLRMVACGAHEVDAGPLARSAAHSRPLSAADWVAELGDDGPPAPLWQRGYLLRDPGTAGRGALVEAVLRAVRPGGPLLGAQIHRLGGALDRRACDAADVRGAAYLLSVLGAPDADPVRAVEPQAAALAAALAPWRAPGRLPSLHGVPGPDHPARHDRTGAHERRLAGLRAALDPDGVIAPPVHPLTERKVSP